MRAPSIGHGGGGCDGSGGRPDVDGSGAREAVPVTGHVCVHRRAGCRADVGPTEIGNHSSK